MVFQRLIAASAAAAAIFASGCATSSDDARSIAHVAAPAMPTSLTRLEIARNYRVSPAAQVAVNTAADPSFALAHEGPTLQAGAERGDRHAGAPSRTMALLAAADLPEGWAFDKDQAIRHAKSGLSCPAAIDLSDENRRFLLRDLQAYDAKGLDIGCAYSTDDGAHLTLYASFWPEMSLDDSIAGAVAAIGLRFDVKKQLSVSLIKFESEGDSPLFKDIETPQAAAFDIGEISGAPHKTAVWLVKTHGWHVKARATYSQGDQTAEIVSAIMFAFSHLHVRAKNMAEPITAGGEV